MISWFDDELIILPATSTSPQPDRHGPPPRAKDLASVGVEPTTFALLAFIISSFIQNLLKSFVLFGKYTFYQKQLKFLSFIL